MVCEGRPVCMHMHCMSVQVVVCMFIYASVVMAPLVKSRLVFVILLDAAMQLLLVVILFLGLFIRWETMQVFQWNIVGGLSRVAMQLLGENMQGLS